MPGWACHTVGFQQEVIPFHLSLPDLPICYDSFLLLEAAIDAGIYKSLPLFEPNLISFKVDDCNRAVDSTQFYENVLMRQ